jgi:hypothetical protein
MVVFDGHEYLTEEEKRLKEDRDRKKYWKKWGPYVSERQWATGTDHENTRVTMERLNDQLQYARTTAQTVMLGVVSLVPRCRSVEFLQ